MFAGVPESNNGAWNARPSWLAARMSWRLLTTNAAAPSGGLILRSPGQVEQMGPLGLIQAERARDRFEDPVGNARQIAALHPVVIVDADPGQGRDLLTPEPGDLPRPVGDEADCPGGDLRAPRSEEIPYLGLGVHGFETKPRPRSRRCPVSTWPGPSSHPAPEPCFV